MHAHKNGFYGQPEKRDYLVLFLIVTHKEFFNEYKISTLYMNEQNRGEKSHNRESSRKHKMYKIADFNLVDFSRVFC